MLHNFLCRGIYFAIFHLFDNNFMYAQFLFSSFVDIFTTEKIRERLLLVVAHCEKYTQKISDDYLGKIYVKDEFVFIFLQ